jgi:hypothetical protein
MHEFMKNMLDWVLDKEEKSANNCNISLKDIEKQINIVAEKKHKYEKECKDTLHEFDHILLRLNKIKEQHKTCD